MIQVLIYNGQLDVIIGHSLTQVTKLSPEGHFPSSMSSLVLILLMTIPRHSWTLSNGQPGGTLTAPQGPRSGPDTAEMHLVLVGLLNLT